MSRVWHVEMNQGHVRRRRTPVSVFASKDLLSLCVCVGVWLPAPPPCAAASLPPCLPLFLHLASSAFPASSSNSSSRNCSFFFFSCAPAAKQGGPQFPVPIWGRADTLAPQHVSLSHPPPPAFSLLAQHPAPCTLHQGQAHNVSVIQPPAKPPCSGRVALAPLHPPPPPS